MKKMKLKLKILVIVLLSLMLILLTKADSSRRLHDPRVDNWYQVSDWELDVCSKWGGTGRAQSGTTNQEGETRLSQLEVTLQGFKMQVEDEILYEIAWYLKPFSGEEEYTVTLVGKDRLEVYSGSASSTAGSNGYDARYVDANVSYDTVELKYDSGKLEVPIVEKN